MLKSQDSEPYRRYRVVCGHTEDQGSTDFILRVNWNARDHSPPDISPEDSGGQKPREPSDIRVQEKLWSEWKQAPNPVSQAGRGTVASYTGILCGPARQGLRTHPFFS